jgi:hypothetical protein
MDNKKLWSTVGVAGVVIVLISLLSYRYNGFKKDIKLHEQQLDLRFDQEYSRIISTLKDQNAKAFERFADGFNKSVAIEKADTSYYMLSVDYEYPSLDYLNCLRSDVEAGLRSERNESLNEQKKADFVGRFGKNGSEVLSEMEKEGVFTEEYTECSKYFGNRQYTVYSEVIWDDVEEILSEDTRLKVKAIIDNDRVDEQFLEDLESAYNQVRWSYRSDFEEKVKSSIDDILVEEEIETKTTTPTVGSWVTTTQKIRYDQDQLSSLLDQVLTDQWRSNSLSTGTKPYANCFGTSNSCSGYSCSQFKVTAGGKDVVASIKNRNGRVVRHAYINSRSTYTFDVPNGSYRIFFYSGSGWNPNKPMNSSTCSRLEGGFVSGESITKGPQTVDLYNQIMSYELYEQIDGNFQTRSSSESEAF